MKFGHREIYGGVIIDLKGKLTGGPEAETFRELFNQLVSGGKKNVIVNMKDVDWISSTGIGILMRGYKSIREAGGEFVLCHVGDRTQQVFNVLRLYDIFTIVETEEDAKRRLAGK